MGALLSPLHSLRMSKLGKMLDCERPNPGCKGALRVIYRSNAISSLPQHTNFLKPSSSWTETKRKDQALKAGGTSTDSTILQVMTQMRLYSRKLWRAL